MIGGEVRLPTLDGVIIFVTSSGTLADKSEWYRFADESVGGRKYGLMGWGERTVTAITTSARPGGSADLLRLGVGICSCTVAVRRRFRFRIHIGGMIVLNILLAGNLCPKGIYDKQLLSKRKSRKTRLTKYAPGQLSLSWNLLREKNE